MSTNIALPLCGAVALILSLSACGAQRHGGDALSTCKVTRDGVELFLGTEKCLKTLPKAEMSGYWVIGHEYSVLYPDLTSVRPGFDEDAMWVELTAAAYDSVKTYLRGTRQVFEVRFTGTRSVAPGLYGYGGFASAALMERVETIREIPQGEGENNENEVE